jgi:hypothetical protein
MNMCLVHRRLIYADEVHGQDRVIPRFWRGSGCSSCFSRMYVYQH